MAFLTKFRPVQMTGSYGTSSGDINDQVASAHTGSYGSLDLSEALSHLAGAVKRIHGGTSFSANAGGTFYQDVTIGGVTPKLTIGDAGAEDTFLVFDGNAQDFRIGLDDGTDKLEIGVGAAHGTTTAMTVDASQQVVVVAATEATSATDGALSVTGGVSVAKSVVIGDDLDLLSNSAILKVGSDQPFTLTHANANNTLLASANHRLALGDAGEYIMGDGTDMKIMSSGDVDITATLVDVTGAGTFSGILKTDDATDATSKTDGSLQTDGGLSVAKKAYIGTGLTVEAGGAHLTAGRLTIDDATDATSTTDGSLQTDGGLSVVKDVVAGNDIKMLSDGAILGMGVNGDVSLTHIHDVGVRINAGMQMQFGDGGADISRPADGTLQVHSDVNVLIDSEGSSIGNGINLRLGTDTNATSVAVSNNSGVPKHLFDAAGNAKHIGNLLVEGDFIVAGDTTYLTSSNLAVQDAIIAIGTSGSLGFGPASQHRGIVFGSGLSADPQHVLYHGGSGDNRWHLGLSATGPLSQSFATPSYSAPLRVHSVEIGDANNRLLKAGDHLSLDASGDIILDAAGGNVVPGSNNQAALGVSGTAFADLFLASGAVIDFNASDITLTHSANTLTVAGGTTATAALTTSTIVASGIVKTDDTTDATSKTDGSLQTDGGLSVAKAIYNGTAATLAADSGIVTMGAATALTVSAAGLLNVNNATEATSATDGSLQTDGGLSVVKSAVIGDDLDLLSDGAIMNIGSTSKFTLTDQAANNCVMASSGHRLAFGDAGEYIAGDGTDLKIVSSGDVDITGDTDVVGGLSSTQATVLASSAGTTTIGSATGAVVTAAGIVQVNNTTEATSATDGSLQTDGGLSVAKDVVGGNDLILLSDSAVVHFGAGKDVTLTHVNDAGLILNSTMYLGFNDAGTKLSSSENGQLDLGSDGTMVDSILANASAGGIKLNAGLDGNAAAIHLDSASGITIAGGDQNDSVYIENSPLMLEKISAPSTTTDKLYNVNGVLYWNGLDVGGRNDRAIIKVDGLIASGTNIATNADSRGQPYTALLGTDGLVFTGMGSPIRDLEVYVNGQLLVSGTDPNVGTGDADYTLFGSGSAKFGFGLEDGDIVQFLKRERA